MLMSNFRTDVLEAVQVAWGLFGFPFFCDFSQSVIIHPVYMILSVLVF